MEEFSERSSLLSRTTLTSTSTIPGLGSLSGKVIKRLGQVVVNGVDSILIRRRLGQIEEALRAPSATSHDLDECYADLLELSRPVYTFQTRQRACRMLMSKIGAMDFEGLAMAVTKLRPVQDAHEHLSYVLGCLWNQRTETSAANDNIVMERNLLAYRIAGLKSYEEVFVFSKKFSQALFCSPFLLYLALITSFGGQEYAQIVAGLDIVGFLREAGVFDASTMVEEGMPARLLLCVLARTLDSTYDAVPHGLIALALNELQLLHQIQQTELNHRLWAWADFDTISVAYLQDVVRDGTLYMKAYLLDDDKDELGFQIQREAVSNLLLLGAGECGKTTVMKQLQVLSRTPHLDAYCSPEAIVREILGSLLKILNPHRHQYIRNIMLEVQYESEIPDIVEMIRPHMRIIQSARETARIGDEKSDYYLDLLETLCSGPSSSYSPSDEDILQCYVTTTGIHATDVHFSDKLYRVHDFGGRRSERKKWIGRFRHASLVVFVASLSEYDQVLAEVGSVNRLAESVTLFESICNTRWFTQIPMFLLLNKRDVLERKIEISPISNYFPDYIGGADVDAACNYFKGLFQSVVRRQAEVPIYFLSSIREYEVRDVFHQIHRTLNATKT